MATVRALRYLADIFVVLNDEESALNLFCTALAGAKMNIYRLQAECMVGIGDIMERRGNMLEAKKMWETAIPFFIRSSQTKDATAVEVRLVKLSLAWENQDHRLEPCEEGRNSQAGANEEPSQTLEQLALLSAPHNSPSIVTKGSMQPTSSNSPQSNETGESNCTIEYPFCS